MKKLISTCAVVGLIMVMHGTAGAGIDTFLPGDPDAGVQYAANMNGFFVNSTGMDLFGATAWASTWTYSGTTPLFGVQAGTNAGSYADAGIVLYFDGSLTLGQLDSVTISTAASDPGNTTPSVNLWLDSNPDNQFFAFSGERFTGLEGDSYSGATVPGNIDGSTGFYMLGGNGSGGTYTLADLQSGMVSGIGANTKVALWIGITNGSPYNYANITQVDVATVPAPGAILLAGLGTGLVGWFRRRQAL